MRIVFDTNVLIAALISDGFCQELVDHCFRTHEVVLSDFIIDELRENLQGKFKYSRLTAGAVIEFFVARAEVVTVHSLQHPVSRDPDDDNIIATAVTGNCQCIVTGDKDLLTVDEVFGIRILSPREFFEYES